MRPTHRACFVLLAGFAGVAALALGAPATAQETETVPAFTKVHVEGPVNVRFVKGEAHTIRIVGGKASTRCTHALRKGELTIFTSGGGNKDTVVEVSVAALAAVSSAGPGDVEIRDFEGQALAITTRGSGDVKATGTTRTLTLSVQGSADLDLKGLTAESAEVSVMGSGDVEVRATGTLTVNVMGSGNVTHYGGASVTKNVLGSGSVKAGK